MHISGTALHAWFASMPLTAATALGVLSAVFVLALVQHRHRIVDVAWGPAFCAVALVGYLCSSGHGDPVRRALAFGLTALWGLRLGVHIARRGRGAPEDPRYEALLAKARGNRTWFTYTHIYLLQAALVWFVSLPVQAAEFGQGSPGPLVIPALALWLLGFCFETIGDFQLARFKADPANRGRLMRYGLWSYTRHPNYFGDACVWWGLFLLCADQWAGWCTVLSPIVMTLLLTAGSGMRLAERHMAATRPEYADYRARTSAFVPRPPRRPGHGR